VGCPESECCEHVVTLKRSKRLWCEKNSAPSAYTWEAKKNGISIQVSLKWSSKMFQAFQLLSWNHWNPGKIAQR
jgi:hypothetical protein